MELAIKQKTALITAGKIALAVACVLACVGSMWLTANRTAAMFDHDPWQEFLKNLTFDFYFMWRDTLPFTAAGVIGLAGTVVLWALFFRCRDMVTGLILLPMCILPRGYRASYRSANSPQVSGSDPLPGRQGQ